MITTIRSLVPPLDENQLECIQSVDGPLQLTAESGSGKTLILALRALYLLMTGRARPQQILITTFTNRAAVEMQQRLYKYSNVIKYEVPISEIKIGTIHSICNQFVKRNLIYCPLRKNYEILNDLKQGLFLIDHFDVIVKNMIVGNNYFGRWDSKLGTARKLTHYFYRINEELMLLIKIAIIQCI